MEIVARLAADAIVKTVRDDRKVVSFGLAINESYRPKGSSEVKKPVTYVQCSLWLGTGIAPYPTIGTLVELQSRIGLKPYKDMRGEARVPLTFHVNNIKLHGGGNKAAIKRKWLLPAR